MIGLSSAKEPKIYVYGNEFKGFTNAEAPEPLKMRIAVDATTGVSHIITRYELSICGSGPCYEGVESIVTSESHKITCPNCKAFLEGVESLRELVRNVIQTLEPLVVEFTNRYRDFANKAIEVWEEIELIQGKARQSKKVESKRGAVNREIRRSNRRYNTIRFSWVTHTQRKNEQRKRDQVAEGDSLGDSERRGIEDDPGEGWAKI